MKTALATTAIALGLGVTSAQAALVSYTNYSDFTGALATAGLTTTTQNFDGIAADTVIASGASAGDLTFTYSGLQGGASLMISDNDPGKMRSTPNVLGTNRTAADEQMTNPDGFTISFPDSYAFGLWFLTPEAVNNGSTGIFDDDFMLTIAGDDQGNATADVYTFGTGFGYFIGFIDTVTPFSSATVSTYDQDTGNFTFRIDDVEYASAAMPIPSTLALFALGGGLLGFRNFQRRR